MQVFRSICTAKSCTLHAQIRAQLHRKRRSGQWYLETKELRQSITWVAIWPTPPLAPIKRALVETRNKRHMKSNTAVPYRFPKAFSSLKPLNFRMAYQLVNETSGNAAASSSERLFGFKQISRSMYLSAGLFHLYPHSLRLPSQHNSAQKYLAVWRSGHRRPETFVRQKRRFRLLPCRQCWTWSLLALYVQLRRRNPDPISVGNPICSTDHFLALRCSSATGMCRSMLPRILLKRNNGIDQEKRTSCRFQVPRRRISMGLTLLALTFIRTSLGESIIGIWTLSDRVSCWLAP